MKGDGSVLRGETWHYYLSGEEVTQEAYEAVYPPPKQETVRTIRTQGTRTWPMVGKLAVNCHPSQVEEMRARNKSRGVNVDYDPEGKAQIPDETAYRKLQDLLGARNREDYR